MTTRPPISPAIVLSCAAAPRCLSSMRRMRPAARSIKWNPEFYSAATGRVIPNIHRLLVSFRGARLEVTYTVIENLAEDGRDRSLDYKLSNISVAKGSWEAQVMAEIAPKPDEIVLPKTSSSVFNSTILD